MTNSREPSAGAWSRGVVPALLASLAIPATAGGDSLRAVVLDGDGEPVRNAVVYALPVDGNGAPLPLPPREQIDQVDKEFVPTVTAVQVGTRVQFPNHDQIRHHVYSFSDAKTFEIPLYEGIPAEPILFDKPGPVVLGCNIHDWMRAWVFVVETSHFAVTGEDGRASVEVPAGDYTVRVWHPELRGDPTQTEQHVSTGKAAGGELRFAIEQKRLWRPRRSPSARGPGYR